MKIITIRQFAAVKRVAQNVNPLVIKKNKIAKKIDELNKEYNLITDEIEGHEMGIKALTGHVSEYLVTKTVEDTGKVDKNGKEIKITKYEPSTNLKYNEVAKVYEIAEEPTVDEGTDSTIDDAPLEEKESNDGLKDVGVNA